MFFRKPKIKETKRLPFRGRQQSTNYSSWDNMSIIEKFAMIFLPIGLGFILYTMLDMFIAIWWVRLIMSIGIVAGLIGLISLLVTWIIECD